jgi:uncharacterized iron-regulated membrane protein
MLYVAFPELTESERFSGLEPMDLGQRCSESSGAMLEGAETIVISMMAGTPVARVDVGFGASATFDLVAGEWLEAVPEQLAETVAASHLTARGFASAIAQTEITYNDQWTVYQRFHAHRPLYKVSFDSARGDAIYVSGTTAEVVQDTHARERFWNWLGAVPHWLYYTAFRERQTLWYQFVVYASVVGTLLVLSGLYLGITRTLAAGGRWTRYLGPMRWHHLTGLIFGFLTLTWVVSGLFSMNPWGWLESRGPAEDIARLEASPRDAADIDAILRLARDRLPADTVSLEIAPVIDADIVFAVDGGGQRLRLQAKTLAPATVDRSEVLQRLGKMRPDADIDEFTVLNKEDAYYFGHKSTVTLPVYRAILNDDEATRYYFDAVTGGLVSRVDRASRMYRWLHYGLHRLDFGALLRSRPLWDIVILPLLIGVSGLCLIGCWIGFRHLRYR